MLGTTGSTTRGYSGTGSAGVYGAATDSGGVGVMGKSNTTSSGSNATFASRVPVGGIYGVTTNSNGNAGFFHGRVVIENTTASGSTTVSRDPFIIWTDSGGSGFNSSGVLFTPSDRNVKENFVPTDGKDVLAKVAALPLSTWNYKCDDKSIVHMGPMAQDFKASFGLNGENDKVITSLDISGVALVAIQGLNQVVEEQKTIITAQAAKLADVDARLARIESEAARNRLQSAGIGAAIALPLIFGFGAIRRRNQKA